MIKPSIVWFQFRESKLGSKLNLWTGVLRVLVTKCRMTLRCMAQWQFRRLKESELYDFLKRQSVPVVWKCILIENVEFVWLWLKSLCVTGLRKLLTLAFQFPLHIEIYSVFLTEVKNKIIFCLSQNLSTLTELSERFERWGILLHGPEGPESCGCKALRAEFVVGKHVLYLSTLRIGVSWVL